MVLSVNISPYAREILKSFMAYGLNPSKTIDWLVKVYTNGIIINEPNEPKKVKKPKPIEVKQQQAYPEKPFVHVSSCGPIVKKTKMKLTRRYLASRRRLYSTHQNLCITKNHKSNFLR